MSDLDKFKDAFAEQVFGRKRDGTRCVTCGSTKVKPEDFRDDLSRKEFRISFMCQACQDSVFGSEE
jgi:hypothetical protein